GKVTLIDKVTGAVDKEEELLQRTDEAREYIHAGFSHLFTVVSPMFRVPVQQGRSVEFETPSYLTFKPNDASKHTGRSRRTGPAGYRLLFFDPKNVYKLLLGLDDILQSLLNLASGEGSLHLDHSPHGLGSHNHEVLRAR